MTHLEIHWPEGGLSDDKPYSKQPPQTTRSSQNCRTTIPDTNRAGGGQRSGLSKKATNQISVSGKVKDLATVTYDSRNITYAAHTAGNEEEVWSNVAPAKDVSRNCDADRQGNVYALDGKAGMVKYNSEGTELSKLALPVADGEHVLRALHVDQFDNVYLAVSEGGDSRTARMWRYAPSIVEENAFTQEWELEPGGYVEEIKALEDKLYTVQNFPEQEESKIVVYDFATSSNPEVSWETVVPFPANDMDVNTAGEPFTAHPATFRSTIPGGSLFKPLESWTPFELRDFSKRCWAWFRADDLSGEGLDDGDNVILWRDRSGNERHFYQAISDGKAAPTYRQRGIANQPSVAFEGALDQGLRSAANPGTAANQKDLHKAPIPSYSGSAYAAFMVVRAADAPITSGQVNPIIYQEGATGGTDDEAIVANRSDHTTLDSTSGASAGSISYYTDVDGTFSGDGVGGTGGQPLSVSTGAVQILFWINDGGLEPGSGNQDTKTRGLFWDGLEPADRYENDARTSANPVTLGYGISSGSEFGEAFSGEIAEMIFLDLEDSANEPKILTHQKFGTDPGGDDESFPISPLTADFDEVQAILAYLHWRYGVNPNASSYVGPYARQAPSPSTVGGPPLTGREIPISPDTELSQTHFSTPMAIKWPVAGTRPIWIKTAASGTVFTDVEGLGFGIRVQDDGVYCIGNGAYSATTSLDSTFTIGDDAYIRKLVDSGSTFSTSGTAWTQLIDGNSGWDNQYPKSAVDEFGSFYVPYFEDDTALLASVVIYDDDGSMGSGTELHSILLTNDQPAYAVALHPTVPDYGAASIAVVENIYLATSNNGTDTVEAVHRIRLVTSTQSSGSPRTMVNLAVVDDDIVTFDGTGPTTPTGGAATIDTNAQYIQSVTAFGRVYFTDGDRYHVYDPEEDEVTEYKSASSGEIPSKCKLIELWRGRIVLARDVNNPYNWYMSKKDDPTNWDFFPPVRSAVQAVAGNNTEAGERHDIINAIIPINDDLLLFGGDSTIFRLSGDPQAGGELDLLTDKVGVAFGRAYDKDDKGVLFFFGSRGGAYRLQPSGQLDRISEYSIDRRLEDVDLSTYYIRVVYNYEDDTVHFFQMPYGAGGTIVQHWVWDTKREAWWEDEFGATAVQPTAAIVVDGDDPDDRQLLIGCEDGFVRKWDKAALDDDGNRIDSFCTMGVFAPYGSEEEYRFSHFQISLVSTLDACRFDFIPNTEVDVDAVPYMGGDLEPGRNPFRMERFRAVFPLLRLRNASLNESWGLEEASIRAFPSGRRRVRG